MTITHAEHIELLTLRKRAANLERRVTRYHNLLTIGLMLNDELRRKHVFYDGLYRSSEIWSLNVRTEFRHG